MSQHCLGYKVTGDTAGSAWRWGVLQVQKASPSPSLSRWRRWEEPCGCWATRTERLVVLQPEHFSFFRQVLATVPVVFRHGAACKFPAFFATVSAGVLLQRLASGSGRSVVVAEHTCYLRKKHAAQATSCVHTSSRSLVPWSELFFLR